ncbi:hypothetical protein RCOM_0812510 [Ricinus communis]|uniref:Uncharacterized protein n=1 Tax=Ricinus communis TaxID=3988 RepID=B9RYE7_RICCO|nr:hypothetical protein RCOM_0812510 [Ricinus communis]
MYAHRKEATSDKISIYQYSIRNMEDEEASQKLVHGNIEMAERGEAINPTTRLDEVVENYIGSLGFSQLIHVFLISLAWIFDSQNTLVTIFSDRAATCLEMHITSPTPCKYWQLPLCASMEEVVAKVGM